MTYSASITLTEAELRSLRARLSSSVLTKNLRSVLTKCEAELEVLDEVAESALKTA